MKSGFDLVEEPSEFDEHQIEFLRKTVCIMKILTEEAMKTAERFVKACGRTVITGNDMYFALMYEAHEFFDKDFDERFFQELEHEREHTYDTEDESGDESTEEMEVDDETEQVNETYSIDLKDLTEKEFHAKVLKYSNEWRNWVPDDPVKIMLKKSIDKTQCHVDTH